jgi:nitroreductase
MNSQKKVAVTSAPIHDVLRNRWSPRAFDGRPVGPEKVRSLLEAARWASSSYNAQPWRFIVGTGDDPATFKRILDTLIEVNRSWAKNASVLILTVAKLKFDHNGEPNRHALYDVGQAAANLATQATDLGLGVHQMAGFSPEKARELFHIPDGYEAVSALAVGYPGDPASLPDPLRERELAPRERKPLAAFVFSGDWGKPSPIVQQT